MSPVLGEPVLHFHQVNSGDQQNQKSKVSSENFKGWLVSVISIVTLQVKMGMLELKWYP